MEPAGFSLREPERASSTEVSSGASSQWAYQKRGMRWMKVSNLGAGNTSVRDGSAHARQPAPSMDGRHATHAGMRP